MNTATVAAEFGTLVSHSKELLSTALTDYAQDKIAISFSGAEDVVLIDLVHKLGLQCNVFSLDTGRLHPETYRYFETVRNHYGLTIELVMPEPSEVTQLVQQKGLFSFLTDGHGECCRGAQNQPATAQTHRARCLDNRSTYGSERDWAESPPSTQTDEVFQGPTARCTDSIHWPLGVQQTSGTTFALTMFLSIHCMTRVLYPLAASLAQGLSAHEHERAGRWWWELKPKKNAAYTAKI